MPELPTEDNEWGQYMGPNGIPRIDITPPAPPLDIRRSAKGNTWVAQSEAPATPYTMAPNLLEAQMDTQSLPIGYAINDAGIPFNLQTGKEDLPTVRRPNVLPIAMTPDGPTFAMPKMLDLASNIMGGIGAPAVATKAGEVVLGSGAVRTAQEAAKVEEGPFFSALENAVDNAKIGKASADQWLGYLKNQPGVKSEEINTVLGDIKGPLTKAEVQDIVKQNGVKLGEVTKGGELDPDNIFQYAHEYVQDRFPQYNTDHPQYQRLVDDKILELEKEAQSSTKYHGYQLPGGENYKETLLTLPPSMEGMTKAEIASKIADLHEEKARLAADRLPNNRMRDEKRWHELSKEQERLDNLRNGGFKSSHWDEPNIVAHIRHNDRMLGGATPEQLSAIEQKLATALGTDIKSLGSGAPEYGVRKGLITETEAADITKAKNWTNKFKGQPGSEKKSLHLEEWQSDLHQQGRDRGYVGEKEKLQPEFDKVEKKLMDTNDEKLLGQPTVKGVLKDAVDKKIITKEEADTYKRYTDIENQTPVPDLPFKKNWEELALKRMLHKAASEGYEGLSWTPGEAQALRYQNDVRTKLSSVDWHNKNMGKVDPEGNKQILVTPSSGSEIELTVDKHGEIIKGHPELKGKMLDSVLGKDIAKQVLEKSEGNVDAKNYVMNSEGMKAAYDKRGVDIMNALAKKYGSKVEQRSVGENKQLEIQSVGAWKGNERVQVYDVMSKDGKLHSQFNTKAEAEAYVKAQNAKTNPIHYLPITDELRAKAKGGFPLFSSVPITVPVDFDPWKEDKSKRKYVLTPVAHDPFK